MNSHTSYQEAQIKIHLRKAVLEVLLARADAEGKGNFIRRFEVFRPVVKAEVQIVWIRFR